MAESNPDQALREAIAALEAQRAVLGNAVVDAALAPLRARLNSNAAPAAQALALRQTETPLLLATLWQVLRELGDPRASALLERSYAELRRRQNDSAPDPKNKC